MTYSLASPVGWYKATQTTGVQKAWSVDANPITIGSARIANLKNEVIAKLRRKMKEQTVDLSVFAGEGRETVSMLRDLASRLGLLLSSISRGRPEEFIRAIRFDGRRTGGAPPRFVGTSTGQAANLHLLYWYGISPLISDILGISKALEKGLRDTKIQIVSARGVLEDSQASASSLYPGSPVKWTSKVEVSARVKFRVHDPLLATLADLGLTNPLTTLWELKKLSFVVDWGIGIGNWLGQLDAAIGKQILSSSVTTFSRSTGHLEVFEVDKRVNDLTRRWRDFVAEETKVDCKREAFPQGSLPLALMPAVVPKAESFQVLTGLSLIRQRL